MSCHLIYHPKRCVQDFGGTKSRDLYILVHHKSDPNQPWQNDWLDRNVQDPALLEYIFTKPLLAQACEAERSAGNRVFIHRCRYKTADRVICASAIVYSVDPALNRVTFSEHLPLQQVPPIRAAQGQISYKA